MTQQRREKNDSRRSGKGIKSEETRLKVADSRIDTRRGVSSNEKEKEAGGLGYFSASYNKPQRTPRLAT